MPTTSMPFPDSAAATFLSRPAQPPSPDSSTANVGPEFAAGTSISGRSARLVGGGGGASPSAGGRRRTRLRVGRQPLVRAEELRLPQLRLCVVVIDLRQLDELSARHLRGER